MTRSEEANSHPVENRDDVKFLVTSAELKAIVNEAVDKALARQYSEFSETHSRTLSAPHAKPKNHSEVRNKPPPASPKPKKDEDRHSSNENSVHPKKLVVDETPRAKGCTRRMPPRRNNQLPTTEAGLQERISQAIAQHEVLRSKHNGEPELKRIERFIWGLAPQILSMMTTSKSLMISKAIDLSVALTEEAVMLGKFSSSDARKKEIHVESSGEHKRKFTNFKKHHHTGRSRYGKCENCVKVGHAREACWYGAGRRNGGSGGNGNGNRGGNGNQTGNRNQGGNGNFGGNGNRGGFGNQAGNGNRGGNNNQGGNRNDNGCGQGCFGCGEMGHFKRDFPKNNQACGRVFNIGAREAR
ncbi:keratin, type II cytoskeletal 1-like [Helianthus annuus]|uniref:keratin, type II cytoskeletal 1-like n=1 Tax=Helianthus annuus TaxID=4232 RepID=UPI000B901EEC|nr:keratin, type II cytoskeletal 1-like [Helianthus annuus]